MCCKSRRERRLPTKDSSSWVPGLALSALWCLGKDMVDARVVRTIQKKLTAADFEALKQADMPAWMADALEKYAEETAHVWAVSEAAARCPKEYA